MTRFWLALAGATLVAPLAAAGEAAMDEPQSRQAVLPANPASKVVHGNAADDVFGLSEYTEPDAGTVGDEAQSASDPADRSGLLPGARFSLKHELAGRIRKPHSLPNNRSSFRIEYEKYFLDNYYLHLDVLDTLFWKDDHRAEARGGTFRESTVRAAYLQFSKASTSLKIGRQILVWGESDAGAITDVISPRNASELFFISLEESRISQFMLTLDHFTRFGDWSMFYIPSARFNKYPEKGTAYYIDQTGGMPLAAAGDDDLREFGMRWKKTFGSSDISVMAARLYDNDPALSVDLGGAVPSLRSDPQRFDMIGMSFNLATDKILFSGEVARKSPRAFLAPATLQTVRKDQVDTSLRAEYVIGNAGSHAVSVEAVNQHIRDWEPGISAPRNNNTLVLGWRNNFLNDNLSANWLTVYNQTYPSFQHSLFLSYKVNGRLSLSLDTFYLKVKDRKNPLLPYQGQNAAVFRVLYQF
jgi:hypothetical protein